MVDTKKCQASVGRVACFAATLFAVAFASDNIWTDGSLAQSAQAQQSRQSRALSAATEREVRSPREASAVASPTAACDEKFGVAEFTLPGAKGALKLDSCYRGRDHFICSVKAINTESQKLTAEYNKIVESNYPGVSNIEPICALTTEAVAGDIKQVNDFFPRFNALRAAYERQVNCAISMEKSFKEANLSNLPNAADVVKSMGDAVQSDMKDVATERQKAFELGDKIESAQKSLAVIDKIHAAMCVANSPAASAANK